MMRLLAGRTQSVNLIAAMSSATLFAQMLSNAAFSAYYFAVQFEGYGMIITPR